MRFTYQNGTKPLTGYTIDHGIHRGGFGEVYYAHSDGGKEVALKLLNEQDRDTELRGVSQCLNLKHPNLINIFDLKTDSHGDQWIVMEYVSGSNLEDVLTSFPNGLPLHEVREWLSGLIAGTSFLHDRGIIHRDLKPANTYRENGVVKVGDVGLSKLLESETRRRHTQSVGTVYYMAPEVAQGKYGPEVDVYSIGVMLYEMITGKLPFTGETTAEILMKHLTAQPNLMPIPAALRPVIAHALEKDPRHRTPTARQLELEFLRACQSGPSNNSRANGVGIDSAESQSQSHPGINSNGARRIPIAQPLDTRPAVAARSSKNVEPLPKSRSFGPLPLFGVALLILTITFVPRTNAFSLIRLGLYLVGMPMLIMLAFHEFQGKRRRFCAAKQRRESHQRFPATLRAGGFRHWDTFHGVETTTQSPATDPQTFDPVDKRAGQHERVNPGVNRYSNPWSQLLMGNSFGMAALCATLLSLGCFLVLSTQFHTAIMPSTEHAVLLMSVTILGVWLQILCQRASALWALSRRQRWLVRIANGALLGSCAYGLHQFLSVHIPSSAYTVKSAVYVLGTHPLTESGLDPTWLGYALFFAGWFGIRSPRELDPQRSERFKLGITGKAVVMGFLTSLIFAFPQWYAMLWAGSISTALQLATPWSPAPQMVQRR